MPFVRVQAKYSVLPLMAQLPANDETLYISHDVSQVFLKGYMKSDINESTWHMTNE